MDFGSGWNLQDIEVWFTEFENNVFGAFGPGVRIDGLKISNSFFNKIMQFSTQNTYNYLDNIQVYASGFTSLFFYRCGTRFNVVKNIRVSNLYQTQANNTNGSIARFFCTDDTDPIRGNMIDGVLLTGLGPGEANGFGSHTAIVFDGTNTIADDNTAAIVDNKFLNFSMELDDERTDTEACLFGAQDFELSTSRDSAPDYSIEKYFANNTFVNNTVRNVSTNTVARVYCNCGVFDGNGNGSNYDCDYSIKGSAASAGGFIPRGCLNSRNGAAPAIETCN